MKKILALILAAVMMLSLVACGTPSDNGENNGENNDENTPAVVTPSVEEGTMGEAMWKAFESAIAEKSDISMEELANTLITNPVIKFFGGAMPIEAGAEFFSGFGEYKIEGYESAAMFAPMMGSIAFVGYVFDLAEGTDVNTFIKGLTDNCDPRWNICVTAEQTVVGAIDDVVFFLMCPASLGGEGGDVGGFEPIGGDVIYPVTLEDGTVGYSIWTIFEDAMIEGTATSPIEIANAICAAQVVPFGLGAMEIEAGLLAGFDNYEVTDFTSGAVFMPMIGSIPFIGYIFELEEAVDVADYVTDLQANGNTRWNICVTADEKLCGAFGNTVFFLMCPASIEG
jgi:hypothetical protein